MATKRMTCPLGFWQDPKSGKTRLLKGHKCDATCSMTQRECMDVMRTQGFWVASWGHMANDEWVETSPRRYVVSQFTPSPMCEGCGATTNRGEHAKCRIIAA